MESTSTIRSEVVVVDVQMPFMSMVTFMIKWAVAAIPAFIILALFSALVSGVFIALFAGFMQP